MAERVKTTIVVRAGTMGHGIAEVAAAAGFNVYLANISEEIFAMRLKKG